MAQRAQVLTCNYEALNLNPLIAIMSTRVQIPKSHVKPALAASACYPNMVRDS